MKNNNVLIALATLLIVVAGLGWVLTSRADSTASHVVPQDRVVTTPLARTTTENGNQEVHVDAVETQQLVNRDERRVGTRRMHHRGGQGSTEQAWGHCHEQWDRDER